MKYDDIKTGKNNFHLKKNPEVLHDLMSEIFLVRKNLQWL